MTGGPTIKQNTITALLAAAVVLLAANLATSVERPPQAETLDRGGEPHVVQITSGSPLAGVNYVFRLWSDGAVDMWSIANVSDPSWYGWVNFDHVQRADLNADGCVDTVDLLILLEDWNPCPVPGQAPS
jgi:hypothetical protein